MCQIIPFSLPCCRRVYVEVSKLPSCPNSWPKRKCPPELCIQVRGFEAEARGSGMCWRCIANSSGAAGHQRVVMRPKIDRASLVLGLEEIGVSGRRRKTERSGECWFCGAQGGCKSCGAKEIAEGDGDEKPEITGFKKHREVEGIKEKDVRIKRSKVERPDSQVQKPPTSGFEYPDPNSAPQWQQPYPQLFSLELQTGNQAPRIFNGQYQGFNSGFGAEDFSHDGLPATGDSTPFVVSDAQGSFAGNWQAVDDQQCTTPGTFNSNNKQHTGNKLFGCGDQAKFNPQYRAVEQVTCPVPGFTFNTRSELRQGRVSAGSVCKDHHGQLDLTRKGWKRGSNPRQSLINRYPSYPDPSINLQLQNSHLNQSNGSGLATMDFEQGRIINGECSKLPQYYSTQNAERSNPKTNLPLQDTHFHNAQPRPSSASTYQNRISDGSSQGSMLPQHIFCNEVQYSSPNIDSAPQGAQPSIKHRPANDNSDFHQVNDQESDKGPQNDFDTYVSCLEPNI